MPPRRAPAQRNLQDVHLDQYDALAVLVAPQAGNLVETRHGSFCTSFASPHATSRDRPSLPDGFEGGIVSAINEDAPDEFTMDQGRPATAAAGVGVALPLPRPLRELLAAHLTEATIQPARDVPNWKVPIR